MPAPSRFLAFTRMRLSSLCLSLPGAGTAVAVLAAAAIANFVPNDGRLPVADKMLEAMLEVDVNARVLAIDGGEWQHRVVVFVYPPDSPRVWVWDPATMSSEVEADINDPQSIAAAWFKHQRIDTRVVGASFDDDLAAVTACNSSTGTAGTC